MTQYTSHIRVHFANVLSVSFLFRPAKRSRTKNGAHCEVVVWYVCMVSRILMSSYDKFACDKLALWTSFSNCYCPKWHRNSSFHSSSHQLWHTNILKWHFEISRKWIDFCPISPEEIGMWAKFHIVNSKFMNRLKDTRKESILKFRIFDTWTNLFGIQQWKFQSNATSSRNSNCIEIIRSRGHIRESQQFKFIANCNWLDMLGIHIAKELHCARGLIFIKRTKAITVSIQKQTSTMQIDETIFVPPSG